ncbi:MAG: DNA polymerase III subunit beta [Parcubacteria group bacterium]|nr:MAG: DNA polymerase III subunit beta [Parcubacteria group bacterium]
MKVICTQENLHKGLGLVSNIANRHSNLPVLNNVLIKAGKDGLVLITTDLEIGIKAFVRGKIEKEGEFTVDAKLFNNYVNYLPKENVELNLKDGGLEIKNKNQETTINGLAAEDFPLIPDVSKDGEIELSSSELKRALQEVMFAASLDGSRAEINAVNFNFEPGELVLAATDSYRLAEKKIKIVNDKSHKLIIPLKTLQELFRVLSDQVEQKIKIYLNENQIMFVFDGVELISRVIDGKYPDYKQIIPNEFSTKAKCAVSELAPAIKAVALFCKQGINDIRLSFDEKDQKIIIATASSHAGHSLAKVSADIEGSGGEVVFNYKYLLDGLSNIYSNEVFIKINNNSSPGLIQPVNNQEHLYLVMPIRQ